MTQVYHRVPEELTACWENDSERLTQRIRDMLQKKCEATPAWPSRDKTVGLRLVRTQLLVVGELCGDLGEDFKVPDVFMGENSLLKRDAEIVDSNRRKNLELTKDFKDNLFKMQSSMDGKVKSLYDEDTELYDRIIDGASMADVCEHDAQQIEYEILLPFATTCNNWDIDSLTVGWAM
jgi:hypothetical protein